LEYHINYSPLASPTQGKIRLKVKNNQKATMMTSRIIIALDYPNAKQALDLVNQLDPTRCQVKVGKELFTREGPPLVKHLTSKGFKVFLDLKFHDIPNTVARACLAAA